MKVEIFKTNITQSKQANYIVSLLQLYFSDCLINFDLEDCDRILRIEGNRESFDMVTQVVDQQGYLCEML